MTDAIEILRHAEDVLMKKIKGLKDGKPKWAASEKLRGIRYAIEYLKSKEIDDELSQLDERQEDEILAQVFTTNPPKAQA